MKKFHLALFFLTLTAFSVYAQDEYSDTYGAEDEYYGDEYYGDEYYPEDYTDEAAEDIASQPMIDYYTETPEVPAAAAVGMKIYKIGAELIVNANTTPPDKPQGLPIGLGGGIVFENIFYKNARSAPVGIGARVSFATDGALVQLLEMTAYARFYTPQNLIAKLFSLFLEIDMGVSHYLVNDATYAYIGKFTAHEGLGVGVRFDIKDVVFIDIFGRFGVPFLWEGGLAVGYEF